MKKEEPFLDFSFFSIIKFLITVINIGEFSYIYLSAKVILFSVLKYLNGTK